MIPPHTINGSVDLGTVKGTEDARKGKKSDFRQSFRKSHESKLMSQKSQESE